MDAPRGRAAWEVKAGMKRARTLAKIPVEWRLSAADVDRARLYRDLPAADFPGQFLSDEQRAIVALDCLAIADAVRDGKLTAVEVTTAFCRAAAITHQITNCLHEFFYDQAIERARELDDYYNANKTTVGPLHGVPVSLKDQFHVKGVDTTMGYIAGISSNHGVTDEKLVHKIESQIVEEMVSLGAILYCKSSVAQTLLFSETRNNIIGQTINPLTRNLSCGGSAGGEGVLAAMRASPVGIATDIGGSIRIPAGFCGVFSLNASPGRLSHRDVATTNPGQTVYPPSVGFISSSLDGLRLIFESSLSAEPWIRDPAVVPMPFRNDVLQSHLSRAGPGGQAISGATPLKLGILWSDGFVAPHPPVVRGLRMAAQAIQNAGHKLVDWSPPPHSLARHIHISFLVADGSKDIQTSLARGGEPLIPELKDMLRLRPPTPLFNYQEMALRGQALEQAYSDYWNSSASDDGKSFFFTG